MELRTFESFSKLIYRESGIVLPESKLALLSSRIQRRLTELSLQDEGDYLKIIELDASGEELARLIDAISTNVTYFYREEAHFTIYREVLRKWKHAQRPNFKVWCAAASSGEEPYTLAFEASEVLDLKRDNFSLLGTDICTKVLQKAQAGAYSRNLVEKVPQKILEKYFTSDQNATQFCVRPEIRSKIVFKRLNLVYFPYPLKGPIDIIFCRNVMIYFDLSTRQKIVAEMERLLAPGGYLFLSHSENLLGINHSLEKVGPSVFQKK